MKSALNNLNEQIKKLAYELYEESGRLEGRDLDNWIEAERIVAGRSELQESETESKKRAAAAGCKQVPRKRSNKTGERVAMA